MLHNTTQYYLLKGEIDSFHLNSMNIIGYIVNIVTNIMSVYDATRHTGNHLPDKDHNINL